jgi:aerobic carbon-monoxide dehydrogenase medium subunit
VKPLPFSYAAPTTVEEAVELLAAHGEDGKVLAGGQSLLPLCNFHLARPSCLIDINRVAELDHMTPRDGGLEIGALTRHAALEHPLPGLGDALAPVARQVGHAAIRTRGTVTGSLAHADPAAEWPAVFMCWPGCTVRTASRRGTRDVPVAELFRGYLTSALEPDELATGLFVPELPAGTEFGFAELSRRHGDFALAGAAATVERRPDGTCGEARVVLLGTGPTPILVPEVTAALHGRRLDGELRRVCREAARAAAAPEPDVHASADYRRALAGEMAVRALAQAAAA